MCDGAIYADPGRRSRCRPKGGLSLGYAHRVGGFLSGGYNLGCNLRGWFSPGGISGIQRWGTAPVIVERG